MRQGTTASAWENYDKSKLLAWCKMVIKNLGQNHCNWPVHIRYDQGLPFWHAIFECDEFWMFFLWCYFHNSWEGTPDHNVCKTLLTWDVTQHINVAVCNKKMTEKSNESHCHISFISSTQHTHTHSTQIINVTKKTIVQTHSFFLDKSNWILTSLPVIHIAVYFDLMALEGR